jgi:glycosyltransferase involved in cell wall biosynthesis
MFSIIIPTFNNIDYLKLCIKSLKKNSKYNHELIFHVNEGSDGSLEFIRNNGYKFSYSIKNEGVCVAFNEGVKQATNEFLVLAHDDMYFCPNWDHFFNEELKKIQVNDFFLSGTMVQPFESYINLDCGKNNIEFDEKKLLSKLPNIYFNDFQGTHWQPSLIPLETWNKVGGFSEEFSPGLGSDPDFNMKLWMIGVRLFKGLGNVRVYHFSSVSLRKKTWNNGAKTFLLKWGISIKFFKKFYLRSDQKYNGLLKNPNRNLLYFFGLLRCKLHFIYLKLFKKNEII